MRVQLVYFAGCPNVDATRAALRRALAATGVAAAVEEVETTDADPLAAWGSPTVLVDGRDVAGEAPGAAARCRLYRTERGFAGAPPEAMIAAALRRGV